MKSLSSRSASSKKSSFNFSDCFDSNASIGSILYSRCLLYIVLLISLVNLFYIINFKHIYSLVIFFLVGFVTSFFVKNMIIVILFATFISLFFQSTVNFGDDVEGMENKENEEFKYSYQGEEEEDKEDKETVEKNDEEPKKEEVDEEQDEKKVEKPAEKKKISVTNAAKLKKDMKDYFAVQEKLLDVLATAEPLQQEAMQIKERFSKNKGLQIN